MPILRTRVCRVCRQNPLLESPARWHALSSFCYDAWPIPDGIESDATAAQTLFAETNLFRTPNPGENLPFIDVLPRRERAVILLAFLMLGLAVTWRVSLNICSGRTRCSTSALAPVPAGANSSGTGTHGWSRTQTDPIRIGRQETCRVYQEHSRPKWGATGQRELCFGGLLVALNRSGELRQRSRSDSSIRAQMSMIR